MVSTWALVLIFTFTRYCPRPHWSTLVSDMVVGKLFWLMFFAVSFFHVRNAPVCLANHSFILYSPIFFGSLFSVPVYLTAYLQLRYCPSVCLSPSLPFSSLLLPPATRLCRTSLRRRGPPREERHTQTPHPFEGTTPSIYTAVHRSRFSPAFFLSVPGPALSPRLFSFFFFYKRGSFWASAAVWKSRWPSWAPRPNKPYGFCGRKATLNHAHALVTVCP